MTELQPIAVPSPPPGWFDYRYYLLLDGSLAILRTDQDIHLGYAEWWKKVQSGEHQKRMPDLWTGKARLSTLTESGESPAIAVPLVRNPEIDRFADGRWLVAASRADKNEANGTILHPSGRPSHSFALGDGIKHVRCAIDDNLWVGYFDEGIFGGTLGSGGLVQFDMKGEPLWTFNDAGRLGGSFIDDCYAMSMDGTELWSCYYSSFPITRIVEGKETRWSNVIAGAMALAVDGNHVLLAGGYGAEESRVAVLKLSDGEAKLLGSFRNSTAGKLALMQGRSNIIHIVSDGHWSRISVADGRQKVGA